MRHAANTIQRQWTLLRHLPRQPQRRSTPDLQRYLQAEGFEVSLRSVQRDLEYLSGLFPLDAVQEGQTKFWFWTDTDRTLEIPAMSPTTALTLLLAADYLQPVMPASMLDTLKPYFERARHVLHETQLESWRQKVRLIDRGPPLRPPAIDDEVRRTVHLALQSGQCLQCRYRGRGSSSEQEFKIHPLALVIRKGIYYLVGTIWDYDDVRHLALHRMSAPLLLDEPVNLPEGFDLADYLHTERAFAYPYSAAPLLLKARFHAEAALHLAECTLAEDQQLTTLDDGWVELTATVGDTAELRWWLLGFGDQVEVLAPASLRAEFVAIADGMKAAYLG